MTQIRISEDALADLEEGFLFYEKMKIKTIIFILILFATVCYAGEKEKAFEAAFLKAVSTDDEAMLELVEFSHSTPKLFRDMIVQSLKEGRKKKIESITFSAPAEDATFEFEYKEVTYTTSLPVGKEMKIKYDMTNDKSGVDGTTYRLGLRDGSYKIVAPTPK
ncbi:MAG: hypothetical protein AAGH72_11225 [Verrucomicrobiota bacterium]